jgi:hypothetical protein
VFLLQNWWKSKLFVEVSAKYLALCRAEIIFFAKKPAVVPTGLPLLGFIICEFQEDIGGDKMRAPECY